MKQINAKDVLMILFVIAMYYQFFSISKQEVVAKPIQDNTTVFTDSIMFNIPEHNEIIERPVVINQSKDIKKHVSMGSKSQEYKLSKEGKDFIKKYETCVLKAYNDPDPKRRSIGWGHQIQPGEKLENITQAKADELFENDIEWVNDAINRLIRKNDKRFTYSQGFIDGLGSLIYNCGEHGVTLTEFWSRWQKCRYNKDSANCINESDFKYTVAAVKTSRISAPGHIERRLNEHKLMLQ